MPVSSNVRPHLHPSSLLAIEMKKSIFEIYALAVCFFAVACFTISFGIGAYAVVGILSPETTMNSWQYNKFQTNDAYWGNPTPFREVAAEAKPKERPPEAELTIERVSVYKVAIDSERRESFQTVLKTSIIVVIDILLFSLHWALARRSRTNAA